MKKQINTEFEAYLEGLPKSEQELLHQYFSNLPRRLTLPKQQSESMRQDFERAFLYYAKLGLPLDTALHRLALSRLGGFYARPASVWYPLDDAAKIYPLSMTRNQMLVFRLSVYLTEDIIPELLQLALAFTIKRFPSFATTVKKGFFWHYTDTAKRRFVVEPETEIPCRPLKVSTSGSQSFRVLYYKERISVEFFHILTDGTGGMSFLKTLTAEYLRLLGVEIPRTGDILNVNDPPSAEEAANDFPKATPTNKSSGFLGKPAVQMSGRLSKTKPCQILHFELDNNALKTVAKQSNTSVTTYILALMFVAGRYATDSLHGNLQIHVPVNMRQFYDSKTVRNFSLFCNIKLALSEIRGVSDILPCLTEQLRQRASKEVMDELMNETVHLVHRLQYIPLFIKCPVARLIYGVLLDRSSSNTLSNLGVINVPEEMVPYIKSFDTILGRGVTNRASCSMVTFGNTATLTVVKLTADPSFEEKLLELFEENGLHPHVKGSELYES